MIVFFVQMILIVCGSLVLGVWDERVIGLGLGKRDIYSSGHS